MRNYFNSYPFYTILNGLEQTVSAFFKNQIKTKTSEVLRIQSAIVFQKGVIKGW